MVPALPVRVATAAATRRRRVVLPASSPLTSVVDSAVAVVLPLLKGMSTGLPRVWMVA